MSYETDQLIDRRRLKRSLVFWRVVAVIAIAAAALAGYARFGGIGGHVDGAYVAHVAVEGLIFRDDELIDQIRSVSDDNDAMALFVTIDSPGGGFLASESIFNALRDVSASGKPVVAVIGDTGASGGYMAALGADRIYASRGTVTGSIGVIMETANVVGLLDKLGIKPEIVKSGPLKAQPNPTEPFSDEARANIQGVIDDLHSVFVDMVIERRHMSEARALQVSDGRIFTGGQAYGAGLIDAIGTIEDARDWLGETHEISADLPMHDVTPVDEFEELREMMGSVLGKALFSEGLTLDGVLALWHPSTGF